MQVESRCGSLDRAVYFGNKQELRNTTRELISEWNPATSTKQKGYRKQGTPAKNWEAEINFYSQPTKVHRDNKLSHERHDTTQDGLKWDSLESDFLRSTQTTNTAHDPDRHGNDSQTNNSWTNNSRDQSPRPRRRRRQRSRRRHTTHPLPTNRKLIPKKTKATTINKPTTQQTVLQRRSSTRVNYMSISGAGTCPLHFKWHEVCTGLPGQIVSA